MKHLTFKMADEDYAEIRAMAASRRLKVSELLREMLGATPLTLRQYVFERDAGVCQICSEPVDPDDWQVDHIIPRSLSGPNVPENLQLAHPLCNQRKGRGEKLNYDGCVSVEDCLRVRRDALEVIVARSTGPVRDIAKVLLDAESVALDATQPPGAERGTPSPVPQSARRRAAATPRKARTHACDHRVPAGSYCKDCDR